MIFKEIRARKILASNTKFTLEVEIEDSSGLKSYASVPIGTSKGEYEAKYLEISKAIEMINSIKRFFVNERFDDIKEVDRTLHLIDKTQNFSKIGANVSLAISYASLKLFAKKEEKEIWQYVSEISKLKPKIPRPLSNVIGGGAHGGLTEIQEFLLFPLHQNSFLESISKIAEKYREIAKELKKVDPFFVFSRNLESAWVTFLAHEKILEILSKFADENFRIGLDVAASQIWDKEKKKYVYPNSGYEFNVAQQLNFISDLMRRYPISYVEDPFEENDFVSFASLTSLFPNKLICGDDLYVTNVKRLMKGIDIKATNTVLVKPNQVGTISDTIEFVKEAKFHKLKCVLSHRSAETEETIMAHLAVGLGCDLIKLGIGGERAVKINELIRIEEKF